MLLLTGGFVCLYQICGCGRAGRVLGAKGRRLAARRCADAANNRTFSRCLAAHGCTHGRLLTATPNRWHHPGSAGLGKTSLQPALSREACGDIAARVGRPPVPHRGLIAAARSLARSKSACLPPFALRFGRKGSEQTNRKRPQEFQRRLSPTCAPILQPCAQLDPEYSARLRRQAPDQGLQRRPAPAVPRWAAGNSD